MKKQRGSVTVLAILTMTFIGIIIAGLLPMVTNELKIGTINKDMIEAQYAAEAGAKRAIVAVANSNNWSSWADASQHNYFVDNTITGKYYVVQFRESNGVLSVDTSPLPGKTYIIISDGTVGNAHKTVSVKIDTPSATIMTIPPNGATIQNISTTVSFGANQTSIVSGSAIPSNITGQNLSSNQTISLPSYDYNAFKAKALPLPTIQQNSNDLKDGKGLYYNNTDLIVTQNNALLKGLPQGGSVIFVKGDITFSSSATAMNTNNVFIVATGNITINNDPNFTDVVLVAGGNITFNGGMHVQPGVIATPKSLIINGGNIGFNTNANKATRLTDDFNALMQQFSLSGNGSSSGSLTIHSWSSE